MTTTITKVIGTGGDYTTIAAWEAACPADLTSVDQIWRGECKSESFTNSGNNVITFAGVTTDATRYLELTCQTGASFSDNASVQTNALRYNTANGAAISSSNNYSVNTAVSVETTLNVRLTGLQIASTGSAGGILGSSGTAIVIDRCIVESSANNANPIYSFGGGTVIKNSLIVHRGASPANSAVGIANGTSVFNCTIVASNGTGAVAFEGNYSSPVVKNCAVFNFTAIKSGGNTPTYTTCFTDVASPPSGFTTIAYSTGSGAQFQSITDGTHDFRIKTGSSLKDVGTTDSTNAATDIAGTARPSGASYDVGAWEFVSGGGGGATSNPPRRRAFPFSILNH